MEVEKAVILFYLGLAAAFCGAVGLVGERIQSHRVVLRYLSWLLP